METEEISAEPKDAAGIEGRRWFGLDLAKKESQLAVNCLGAKGDKQHSPGCNPGKGGIDISVAEGDGQQFPMVKGQWSVIIDQ